jgi:hypothetical protein
MVRPIRSHKFRGKRYRIEYHPNLGRMPDGEPRLGFCENPTRRGRRLKIKKGQTPLRTLDTELHEGLHACLWDLDEDAVRETAEDLAEFLWRLGYRKV